MKKPLAAIFFTLQFFSFVIGQTELDLKNKSIDIRNMPQELFVSDYNLIPINRTGFNGKDSLIQLVYPSGRIKSSIKYAIDSRGKLTNLFVGKHELFGANGKLTEKGHYEIGKYTGCCAGGLCSQYYNYKFNKWHYYFQNGQLRAQLIYEIAEQRIKTSCEDGAFIKVGKVNLLKSKFWDKEGNQIEPSIELINELESTKVKH